MRLFLLLLFIASGYTGNAQTKFVDTADIYSTSMKTKLKCVVIKPAGYNGSQRYPVVYLLHGYSGNYSNWIKKMPLIKQLATENNCIIVCPDGGFSSWYVDSPVDSAIKYETFISKEVINYIDKHYKTIADRAHRGITGLSMGGHGALMLALRHQEVFGAAASISGAVNLDSIVHKFDASKRIGDSIVFAAYWKKYSVYNIVDSFSNKTMPLLLDCGTGDIFIKENRALHAKLQALNIPHDYVERTGEHNWAYWTNALPYHLLFFRKFFEKY